MQKRVVWLALFLLLVFAGAFWLKQLPQSATPKETTAAVKQPEPSVLDRVEKTGVIRCGYWIYEPFISKNLETGKVSGLTVDYLEKAASRWGKKIEWTAEIALDQVLPSLNYDKVDLFCVPCSPYDDYKKVLDFVGSFGAIPYYVYVAKDSAMTKKKLSTARFAAIDGYLAEPKTMKYFPQAQLQSLPHIMSLSDLYNQLKYHKTDAIVNESISAKNYIKQNPDIIQKLEPTPLFTVNMSFPVKKGDLKWDAFVQKMTDTSLPENHQDFLDLLKKYDLNESDLSPNLVEE